MSFRTLCICILTLATLAEGQISPGTPSFSAFDRGQYDIVNLQNLNVLLNVPVMSKSGAFPFNASLVGGDSYFSYNGSTLQPGILAQPISQRLRCLRQNCRNRSARRHQERNLVHAIGKSDHERFHRGAGLLANSRRRQGYGTGIIEEALAARPDA